MAYNVLITGARSAVALDLARDFKAAGYSVHAADCSSAFISKWSSSIDRFSRYEAPNTNRIQFQKDIQHLIKTIKPDIVIPTCEEVFHLTHPSLQEILEDKFFAPKLSVLDELHAKDKFASLCHTLGLNTPESHAIKHKDDLQSFLTNTHDWVFKPCYSRFGSQTLIAPSKTEIENLEPTEARPWLAQEKINGEEMSFYAVCKNGQLQAIAGYKSDWRLNGGASYVFETVDQDTLSQMKVIASRVARHLTLSGQLSCDIIKDRNGTLWPIECNPRATSGLHLLAGTGGLARAITTQNEEAITPQDNMRYMLPMMMSYGIGNMLRNKNASKWISTLKLGNDVIGAPKDRAPVIGAIVDTVMFGLTGTKNKCSLTQATTIDIEWNGEKPE